MSQRPAIDSNVATTVAAAHVPWFPLVQMDFDGGTVRLAGTAFDVGYGGNTWTSTRGLGTMEPITESPDQINGFKFTLSGVPTAAISEALSEVYQGRLCTVLWAVLSGPTLYVDPQAWQGRLDVPEITRDVGTCTISVTAEHRMADWGRPRRLLFNHADQQRVDATDNFFLGCEAMEEQEIVVFSKEVMMR